MSVVLVIDCPHCCAENTAFQLRGRYAQGADSAGRAYWMFFSCPRCHGAVTARAVASAGVPPDKAVGDIAEYFAQVRHFPARAPLEAPANLPAEVGRLYLQAAACRRRALLDAAAMTYRKTLEVALVELAPDIADTTLAARLARLAAAHRITPALAEWAREIRLDGNQAAHDPAAPEQESVNQLHAFVHAFLLYTFTLPEMVRRRAET